MNFSSFIQNAAVMALPVLLAITIHEAAHAYVARRLGDPTAALLGRVTLNPFKHIDPFGTVLLPLLLLFASQGALMFGYAKPVPVNTRKLRNPRYDMVWVALAGPLSNLLQAVLWTLLLAVLLWLGQQGLYEPFFARMAWAGIMVNLVLAALNLFPLPPLDGGRIAVGLLPARPAHYLARLEPLGFFIVLGLLWLNLLDRYWLYPLLEAGLQVLLQPLQWLGLPLP
ncbi:site-2 protease family protein [Vandammella animalimorsus]|nr:site-2 protease family protein [Vandammella animalimorsus]